MDCRTARMLMSFARPCVSREESADVGDLETHLADCPECGGAARNEARLDDHIGQALRDVPVPDGLHSRLLAALEPAVLAWYRRRPMKWAGGLGLAAAIALVVWLGLEQAKVKRV